MCHAQVILFTPHGTQVIAEEHNEMSLNDIMELTEEALKFSSNITIIENASYTYNCHSYAWNMTEGGPVCWLNSIQSYFDDLSYIQTTEPYAEKIHYDIGQHSAVPAGFGMYISKWGAGPLVKHAPNDCFYGVDRVYYKKGPPLPDISGPSTICSTGSFSLSDNQSAQWSVSSGFSVYPSTGTSTTVTATTASGQSGTLTATINNGLVNITKSIAACGINGPSTICISGSYQLGGGQSATWSVSSGFSVYPSTGPSTTVTSSTFNGQSGTLTAVVNGITYTKTIQVCSLSISGPEYVCASPSSTFSVTVSDTVLVSWSVSSGLYITGYSVGTTTNSISVASQNETDFGGWVKAVINGNSASALQKTIMTWFSGIQSANIRAATLSRNDTYFAVYHPGLGGEALPGSNFNWSTSVYGTFASPQGHFFTSFYNSNYNPPLYDMYSVTVVFTDICGCSSTIYQTYQDRGNFEYACFPIPVSDLLTIEYRGAADAATRGNVALKLLNIRKELILSRIMKNTMTQTTMDLSNLPDGYYFLDIVKDTQVTERHTIVVKH